MAQLSRPYQIALAATVFLALIWFVALRPHSTQLQLDAGGKHACEHAGSCRGESEGSGGNDTYRRYDPRGHPRA